MPLMFILPLFANISINKSKAIIYIYYMMIKYSKSFLTKSKELF